jgi:DNA-binding CsgD family transcriptional regulator
MPSHSKAPEKVLHAMGDLVLILNRDQRVTATYGRWIQTGRFEASQFTGKKMHEEWPADIAALHIAMNARGLDGQVVVYDWEYPVPGSGHRMMTVICPIYAERGGTVNGAIRASRELGQGLRSVATQAVQIALQQLNSHLSPKEQRGRRTGGQVPGRTNSPPRAVETFHVSENVEKLIFRLSARERHIVGLLLDSARSAQIAHGLNISVHTVRQHVKHILGKAGVHSQQQLLELLRGRRPG